MECLKLRLLDYMQLLGKEKVKVLTIREAKVGQSAQDILGEEVKNERQGTEWIIYVDIEIPQNYHRSNVTELQGASSNTIKHRERWGFRDY